MMFTHDLQIVYVVGLHSASLYLTLSPSLSLSLPPFGFLREAVQCAQLTADSCAVLAAAAAASRRICLAASPRPVLPRPGQAYLSNTRAGGQGGDATAYWLSLAKSLLNWVLKQMQLPAAAIIINSWRE